MVCLNIVLKLFLLCLLRSVKIHFLILSQMHSYHIDMPQAISVDRKTPLPYVMVKRG